MVPAVGVEPTCPSERSILSRLRMPFRHAGARETPQYSPPARASGTSIVATPAPFAGPTCATARRAAVFRPSGHASHSVRKSPQIRGPPSSPTTSPSVVAPFVHAQPKPLRLNAFCPTDRARAWRHGRLKPGAQRGATGGRNTPKYGQNLRLCDCGLVPAGIYSMNCRYSRPTIQRAPYRGNRDI